jgi:hypothetical protein
VDERPAHEPRVGAAISSRSFPRGRRGGFTTAAEPEGAPRVWLTLLDLLRVRACARRTTSCGRRQRSFSETVRYDDDAVAKHWEGSRRFSVNAGSGAPSPGVTPMERRSAGAITCDVLAENCRPTRALRCSSRYELALVGQLASPGILRDVVDAVRGRGTEFGLGSTAARCARSLYPCGTSAQAQR